MKAKPKTLTETLPVKHIIIQFGIAYPTKA